MVCILLSTYNGEKYLEQQLDSLLHQKYTEIKILIRDDGSKDHTADILKRWQAKYPLLIDFMQGENVGFAMSFTRLLQTAVKKYYAAEYYAFCDQDDVWLPEKISKAVEKLGNAPQNIPVTYCSNTRLVDSNLKFMRMCWKESEVKPTKERTLVQSFATGCTMVFNRKAAETYISHIPEKIDVHDFLMYQICIFLGKVIYDNESYILYRQHENNQIGRPGAWKRWKHRLTGYYKKHVMELRSYHFLKAYKELLSLDDILLLSQMAFYRKNIFTRLSLLFNRKIRYTNMESNIMYMLKILRGLI